VLGHVLHPLERRGRSVVPHYMDTHPHVSLNLSLERFADDDTVVNTVLDPLVTNEKTYVFLGNLVLRLRLA
jgi:hypothetical protein